MQGTSEWFCLEDMGTSKKEMMVNNQKIACITYITTILKTHPRKVCIKLVVSPIIQYFTGLGKCPILEILNITFKYLLDIILLYIRNSWVTLPKYSMVLVYLPTFTLKTPSCAGKYTSTMDHMGQSQGHGRFEKTKKLRSQERPEIRISSQSYKCYWSYFIENYWLVVQ